MENISMSADTISPLLSIAWCFYPLAILILVELILGGGFDDDNDDQDGGMMIPAFAPTQN